jgi:hypothetical protein
MELSIKNTFQLFRLGYSIASCFSLYKACSSLVSRFNLSFNETPNLFSKDDSIQRSLLYWLRALLSEEPESTTLSLAIDGKASTYLSHIGKKD